MRRLWMQCNAVQQCRIIGRDFPSLPSFFPSPLLDSNSRGATKSSSADRSRLAFGRKLPPRARCCCCSLSLSLSRRQRNLYQVDPCITSPITTMVTISPGPHFASRSVQSTGHRMVQVTELFPHNSTALPLVLIGRHGLAAVYLWASRLSAGS